MPTRQTTDYALRFDKLPDHLRWICDGEVAVALSRDTGGITNVAYYGTQSFQMTSVFVGDFLKVKIGDQFHQFNRIKVYPFGIMSQHEDVEVTFAVNSCSVMVEVKNPNKREIAYMLDQTCLNRSKNTFWESIPYDTANNAARFFFTAFLNQHRHRNPDPQKDMKPTDIDYQDRLMCGQVYAAAGLAGSGKHRELYQVHVFSTHEAQSRFAIAFGGTNEECLKRFRELKEQSVFSAQKARYDLVNAKAPKVHMKKRAALSEMVNLFPLYYESLKVRGRSVRAVTSSNYWVWGWDALLAAFGMLWARDYDYVKRMIRFYIATARSNGKVAHQFGLDLLPTLQVENLDTTDYLMLALITRYFDFVNDDAFLSEVAPYYIQTFGTIKGTSDKTTGFVACRGLYPDYPEKVAGREKIAYPCMEQTTLYALCCQAEGFGKKIGNPALSESARDIKTKVKRHFIRYFFDDEKGYLYESVSLAGLKPNPCYPKWNIFGIGLKGGDALFDKPQMKRMADFAFNNYFSGDDLRSMPLWDKGKDLAPHEHDVGVWTTLSYPIEDLSLYKLFKCAGHRAGMETTLTRMERIFSTFKVVPELIPTSREEFLKDLYHNTRSSWQAFSMGMWHCLVMEGVLGLDAEDGAIRKPDAEDHGIEYGLR